MKTVSSCLFLWLAYFLRLVCCCFQVKELASSDWKVRDQAFSCKVLEVLLS